MPFIVIFLFYSSLKKERKEAKGKFKNNAVTLMWKCFCFLFAFSVSFSFPLWNLCGWFDEHYNRIVNEMFVNCMLTVRFLLIFWLIVVLHTNFTKNLLAHFNLSEAKVTTLKWNCVCVLMWLCVCLSVWNVCDALISACLFYFSRLRTSDKPFFFLCSCSGCGWRSGLW